MLRRSTAAELDLLRAERKAERKLRGAQEAAARDEAKLRKAEHRLAASRATVATAAEALRACQVRRAAGPVLDLA